MKREFHPQWYIVLLTVAASVAGALIRWRQLQTELLEDGSLMPGSYLHIVLILLTVVLLGALIGLLLPLSDRKNWEEAFTAHPLPNALKLLCAAGLFFGNVLLWLDPAPSSVFMLTQSPEISAFLTKLLPPLGILCALCIGIFAALCVLNKMPSSLLYMAASIYLIVRLIVRFQAWNTDPSIYNYCFQLLAAICCMLGAFQLSGFSLGVGHRRISIFWTLCAAVFSCFSLPDAVLNGTVSEMIVTVSLLGLMAVSALELLFCKESLPEAEPAEELQAPMSEDE